MLKRIEIKNFRGIRAGLIDSLTRLVVILGPNGAAKSTVLEACAVGASRIPATELGTVVQRRSQTWNGARWIVFGGAVGTEAVLDCTWDGGARLVRRLHYEPLYAEGLVERLEKRALPRPYSVLMVKRDTPAVPENQNLSATACSADNQYESLNAQPELDLKVDPVTYVEPRWGVPLHDLFSKAVQAGQRDALVQGVRTVMPALQGLEILTEEGTPRLFLRFDKLAVPATLAGDGISSMLRIAFELAAPAHGTVLLEEPEVHQHPRSLMWCARAILASTRRGVQVILTTHSLELLDRLLSELSDTELSDPTLMSVLRTSLVDGQLNAVSIPAVGAESARSSLEEDLR